MHEDIARMYNAYGAEANVLGLFNSACLAFYWLAGESAGLAATTRFAVAGVAAAMLAVFNRIGRLPVSAKV